MTPLELFDRVFPLVAGGNAPFPWQRNLHRMFAAGDWPRSCSLPTGVGKTSVIPIWLIALASTSGTRIPRRLVYVVNRRTVVDQATSEAEQIRQCLLFENRPDNVTDAAALNRVREALLGLNGGIGESPLVVSTLRGQFADNGEWNKNPAQPAIIVGTVDMIGSRLLFSGYGLGFRSRPLHAGLLGQDTLLVHDEAHLEPAFQELLEQIVSEQQRDQSCGRAGDVRPLRVLELTATSRSHGTSKVFQLTPADYADEVVSRRLLAKKRVRLHRIADEKKNAELVAELALAHSNSGKAILVFLRRLEDVQSVVDRLEKAKQSVEALTGTIRGYERDRLATENRPGKDDSIFARFLPSRNIPAGMEPATGTVFLVCTSAGEVGVNISADHLVCDLTPFESMAQRFGRVNRFGDGDAWIDIVHPDAFDEKDPLRDVRLRTLELMRQLPAIEGGRDGSPEALGKLPPDDRFNAFSPKPKILDANEVLFDAWSLTTIRGDHPGRPAVADWLHGEVEGEPPETHVAWRDEVDLLVPESLDPAAREEFEEFAKELLEDFPLKPQELLRGASHRVLERIKKMASTRPECPAWLLDVDDNVDVTTLGEIAEGEKDVLDRRTVLLPPSVGGLNQHGMLADGPPAARMDVSEEWHDAAGQPRRCRKREEVNNRQQPNGMRLVREILLNHPSDEMDNAAEEGAAEQRTPKMWRWYVRPRSADDDGSWSATKEIRLKAHLDLAADIAGKLTGRLDLEDGICRAGTAAAIHHDDGKHRELWQKGIGNREYPQKVLAKSNHTRRPLNGSYRHEFGSLFDVRLDREFEDEPADVQELILQMIAAHHGRARPHFPVNEAFDPNNADAASLQTALAVPQRFARLQRKYGRWGLAWLESILRTADYLASGAAKEDEK